MTTQLHRHDAGTDSDTTCVPQAVAVDLYRDIHKGLRVELFDVTRYAGRVDPADADERARFATRVRSLVGLLVHHAAHEDAHVNPLIEGVDAALVRELTTDHADLDGWLGRIALLADRAAATDDDARNASHVLYLELASFTAAYLQHQDLEERVVMRVLDDRFTVPELRALHGRILASIEPAMLARCQALMLPAMNIADRTELLAGMRATAPDFVFAAAWNLAGRVLSADDLDAVGRRLGIAGARPEIG